MRDESEDVDRDRDKGDCKQALRRTDPDGWSSRQRYPQVSFQAASMGFEGNNLYDRRYSPASEVESNHKSLSSIPSQAVLATFAEARVDDKKTTPELIV